MQLNYKLVNKELSPEQSAYVICAIKSSENYEINDLSHIIVKEKGTEVGYVGDNTFELIESNNPTLEEHHKNIKSIYDSALKEFYMDERLRKKENGLVNLVFD